MVKFVNNNGTDFQSKLGFQFTNKVILKVFNLIPSYQVTSSSLNRFLAVLT